jgi:hypothetical protein
MQNGFPQTARLNCFGAKSLRLKFRFLECRGFLVPFFTNPRRGLVVLP